MIEEYQERGTVNKQDPVGPSRGRPLPPSPVPSAAAPLCSTQITVPHLSFLSFSDAENHHHREDANYLMMVRNTWPQACRRLGVGSVGRPAPSTSARQGIVHELMAYLPPASPRSALQ